jgi:hypothetical protein
MSYTKSTVLLLLIILVTVAGCSHSRRTERAELAQRAKTELIGLSKIELCALSPALIPCRVRYV